MKYLFLVAIFFALGIGIAAQTRKPKMKLVWSDEFSNPGLPDKSKWSYDVGGHGWGNQEKQYYTAEKPENARVENGNLIIEARKEKIENSEYSSARLVTQKKGDWKFGRVEVRAIIPKGIGVWSAIWMLPSQITYSDKRWVDNGEIDIMENVGYEPGVIHTTIHTKAFNWMRETQKSSQTPVSDADSKFHIYAVEWDEKKLEMFIDKKKVFTHENDGKGWESYPFDQKYHLILNIAIGGTWGGKKGIDDSMFPQKMIIDWVRVYQSVN